ncbi:SitI3 family protein [Kribbella sp. NPDC055071]
MAIEYWLQLNTSTTPAAVGQVLVPPLVQIDWDNTEVFAYKGESGLSVTVRADGEADLVLEEPDVSVGFRLDKFADFPAQYDELVRVVVRLLTAESGDAVLQQDYERILLLRRADSLTISEDFWTPELLPWKFTQRRMPYPEG